MVLYFLILAGVEVVLSVLAACKARTPGQITSTVIVCCLLAMTVNTLSTKLPFILFGIASITVIVQLFTIEPNPE
jgi:hypothetical protein